MNPCPQCGAVPQPSDKFCNICGTPVAAGASPGFGGPPQAGGPPQNAYGAPPAPAGGPPRCQMGHEITPGASYCAHGHPIALDAMPFGNDQYGGGYGHGAPPGGFAPPPHAPGGFGQAPFGAPPGAPPPGYGGYPDPNAPAPYGGGFGAPPQQQHGGFGGAPYAAPPAQPGYGGPQPGFPQPGFPGAGPEAAPAPAPNLPPNALRGFLVSYQSNTQGEFWSLTGGRKTVGRAGSGEQVDIPLADATISSRHAAFVVDAIAGTVQIEDTGSTNGTFVNEEHIGPNGKRDLRDGDRIRFGGYTAIVKIIARI